jgi:hypothetical protein
LGIAGDRRITVAAVDTALVDRAADVSARGRKLLPFGQNDLVSSTASSNEIVELRYGRQRLPKGTFPNTGPRDRALSPALVV